MLLWALRDGMFTNGGQRVRMPLVLAIGCSNEIPEDSSRRAIYDRLLIREEVKDIEMPENFRQILDRNGNPPPKVPKCELEDLWRGQEQVKVPANIKDLITDLREKMHDAGVRSSNRRWFDSIGVLKASAKAGQRWSRKTLRSYPPPSGTSRRKKSRCGRSSST
jgi:MoxR-like ATPase